MGINGISTAYYQAGYRNVKPTNDTVTSSFKDTISEKAASEKIDYGERTFEFLAPYVPEEVKKAWMEAAKETGTNGMGMGQDGRLTHISAMLSIRFTNQLKGNWSS